jgi:hypothetical protein
MPSNNHKKNIKILSLDDANQLLPTLIPLLHSLQEQKKQIFKMQVDIEIEELTGTDDQNQLFLHSKRNIDQKMQILERHIFLFENTFNKFKKTGAVLKDLEKGLVDFYYLKNNEIVFLCWILGEPSITHWHSLEGGFAGRQPLD